MNAVEDTKLDRDDVDITQNDIKKALEEPDSFAYFESRSESKMFITWSIGPVFRTRDSEAISQSNARMLIKKLRSDPTLKDDWKVTQCSHWACGWVDHLSFRAIEPDAEIQKQIDVIDRYLDRLAEMTSEDERAISTIVLESQCTLSAEHDKLCDQLQNKKVTLVEQLNVPTRIFRVITGWFEDLSEYPIVDEEDCSKLAEELSVKHLPYICKNLLIDNPHSGWEYDLYSELTEEHSSFDELYPSEDEVRPLLAALNLLKPAEDSDA